MENIYSKEIQKTAQALKKHRDLFRFALVADSHLDDSVPDTVANISGVDALGAFDCCVHLGDMINGNIPRRYSEPLLEEQMDLFRGTVGTGRFYPVMGNHDEYSGGCPEEFWLDRISFLDSDPRVTRPDNASYYYVDDPEKKVRLIIVCSFFYTLRGEKRTKLFGMGPEQIQWLEREALAVGPEWTVLLFSHDTPFSCFDEASFLTHNSRVNGTEALEALLRARAQRGFRLAGWLVGHYHGDIVKVLGGIPFILVGSQTAYVPQLWDMPQGGCFYPRNEHRVSRDLWDAVAVDTEKRRLYLYRFGAGKDRVIAY